MAKPASRICLLTKTLNIVTIETIQRSIGILEFQRISTWQGSGLWCGNPYVSSFYRWCCATPVTDTRNIHITTFTSWTLSCATVSKFLVARSCAHASELKKVVHSTDIVGNLAGCCNGRRADEYSCFNCTLFLPTILHFYTHGCLPNKRSANLYSSLNDWMTPCGFTGTAIQSFSENAIV